MPNIFHNAIQLPLPAGWEDGTQVVAVGPLDGGFRPNFVVSHERARATDEPETFAARQLPALTQALQRYELIREGPATFGRLSGFLREHAFHSRGAKLGQLQFYVIARGMAFTFTYTHLALRFDQHRAFAEDLLAQAQLSAAATP